MMAEHSRDSYHDQEYHEREESGPFVSRGFRRYDPQTRRYVSWVIPQDWHGHRVGPNNEPQYPHFSRDENRKMLRQLKRSGRVDPARMGQDWHDEGPKVSTLGLDMCSVLAASDVMIEISVRARLVLARSTSGRREFPRGLTSDRWH